MIRTMLYQPATRAITTGNEALLATWQAQPGTILWADFSDNDPHADRFLNRLLTLEPRLEDLEQEIVTHPKDAILSDLIGYKTTLRKFRRALVYHQQVFLNLMNNPPPQIRAERIHEIKDVYEHQERAQCCSLSPPSRSP